MGILATSPKYRLGDLWLNRDTRPRKGRRFRSSEDKDHEEMDSGNPIRYPL